MLLVGVDASTDPALAAAFQTLGLRLEVCTDPAECPARVARSRPSLVLIRTDLPDRGAGKLCRGLGSLPHARHVPRVLYGVETADLLQQAYESGASDLIAGSLPPQLVAIRVGQLLEQAREYERLRWSEERLAAAQRVARLAWIEVDAKSGRIRSSPELPELIGRQVDDVSSIRRFLNCIAEEDRRDVWTRLRWAIDEGAGGSVDFRIEAESGETRVVNLQLEVHPDASHRPLRILGTIQDVTEGRASEQRIRYLANYDTLTSLPNRKSLAERLDRIVARCLETDGQAAVLALDLDRFKRVNDTLGLGNGDSVLREVAARLTSCLRTSDAVIRNTADETESTLATLGGDEFVMLLPVIRRGEDAARIAQRLLDTVSREISLESHGLFLTASVGIALIPADGDDSQVLLRNAESAMQHAKQAGGHTYRFYQTSMNEEALQRLVLENDLRRAVENFDGFELHYQPRVSVGEGRTLGAEALLRWERSGFGPVSPGVFIEIAEETGLIVPLGAWVLRTACCECKRWHDLGFPGMRIAVNVSGRQFLDPGFLQTVDDALEQSGLEPGMLELELTETFLMRDGSENLSCLRELQARGVKVAVDDFGTGYSSLAYLTRFPLDALKIDRSFLRHAPEDPDSTAIVETICALGQGLNLTVVAEGVEQASQLDFLRRLGCDEFQGFLISPGVPAGQFVERLGESRSGGRNPQDTSVA